MSQLTVFTALAVGHLLADFPLQTNSSYELKNKGWYGVAVHAGIHAAITAILIQNPFQAWLLLVLLFLSHFAIDWIKLHVPLKVESVGFLYDQALHLFTLAILASHAHNVRVVLPAYVLTIMLLYAMIPALLMFISILTRDLQALGPRLANGHTWGNRAFAISQITGWPLIVTLLLLQVMRGL